MPAPTPIRSITKAPIYRPQRLGTEQAADRAIGSRAVASASKAPMVALVGLCLGGYLLLGCTAPAESPQRSRNFILISLDTLRADHLGVYGYDRPTSPFLDRLAERALVFDNAFAQYPSTLTSHMSMLTGLYPAEHNVYPPAGRLSVDIATLADRFREANFRTAGYTEGGYMRGIFGFRRGFDDFDARDRTSNQQAEKTFHRGLRFLERVDQEPFFLFLHTYATHAPYAPPANYQQMFWSGPRPPDAFAPTPKNLVAANRDGRPQSEQALAYYRALYDAGIRYLDDVLREFFEELEASGLAKNTTVIITSDHGEEFREHGRFNHEQIYHEVLHVPLLIIQPGSHFGKGRRSQRIAELVDIAPTLLDLAGISGSEQLSGTSLAKDLESTASYPKRTAYAEAAGNRRSLYSLEAAESNKSPSVLLHLLRFPGTIKGKTGEPVELYSTSTDPSEQTNIAHEAANLAPLQQRLENLIHHARAKAEQGALDDELRQQLDALGYLQ